jgi:hypothetical protein
MRPTTMQTEEKSVVYSGQMDRRWLAVAARLIREGAAAVGNAVAVIAQKFRVYESLKMPWERGGVNGITVVGRFQSNGL